MTIEKRIQPSIRFKPELASLNMGSMNFALFPLLNRFKDFKHNREPQYLESIRDLVFRDAFKDIEFAVTALSPNGTRFEFECYDVGHLYNLAHFAERKLIEPPFLVQTVFGIFGNIGTHAEDAMHMRRTANRLFGADYRWSVLGAGRMQMPIAAKAAAIGAHMRLGLEDSLWIGKGRLARSNAEQVRRVRSIVEGLGLAPAKPNEARATSCNSKELTRCRSDIHFQLCPGEPSRLEARRLIALAPAVKCLEHRAERLSLVSQKIFVARWVVLVEARGDHALALETFQPRRQRVRRDPAEPGFKLLEAQRPLAEQVAQDEQRPFLADHIERPRYRAILLSVTICHQR
jgi:uncharacterized protein (DUF849 family)